MKETKLLLLIKLTEELQENYFALEKAYNLANKETFDNSKNNILELQNKIKFLLSARDN